MTNKAVGIDNIDSNFLKCMSNCIVHPLEYVFNLCITQAVWPNALKTAEVVPIFKSGNKHETKNYRSISLISHIAKIFEKAISDRLNEFLSQNNILSKMQFGFRKNMGTNEALAYITNKIYSNLDKRVPTVVAFLDIAKAVDTVYHKILFTKLYRYGIRGNALEFMKSYLSNRLQVVKLGKISSEQGKINIGLPQGSILGPMFFILYINDLLEITDYGDLVYYADDTAVVGAGKTWFDARNRLNEYLQLIALWLTQNHLSLNIGKTIFITFGNNKRSIPNDLNVHINNMPIKRDTVTKYLGIFFYCNMRWTYHVKRLVKKTRYPIFIFKKLRKILCSKTLLKIYYALFNSVATYGIISWGGAYPNVINPLLKVQKKLIKIITSRDNIKEPLTIKQSFELESIVYHYNEFFSRYSTNNIQNNTRYRNIQLPKVKSKLLFKSSYIVGLKKFNKLPKVYKNLHDKKKQELKKIIKKTY